MWAVLASVCVKSNRNGGSGDNEEGPGWCGKEQSLVSRCCWWFYGVCSHGLSVADAVIDGVSGGSSSGRWCEGMSSTGWTSSSSTLASSGAALPGSPRRSNFLAASLKAMIDVCVEGHPIFKFKCCSKLLGCHQQQQQNLIESMLAFQHTKDPKPRTFQAPMGHTS